MTSGGRARAGRLRSPALFAAALLAVAAACAPRATAEAQPNGPAPVPTATAQVLERYPHDPAAFTQGLLIRDGRLFESTGNYGRSQIREVELRTGRVLRSVPVPTNEFGEGLADHGDELVSLSWRNGVARRWRIADFGALGTFRYPGEGWGLTSDGRRLILSDGSATLRFLDPRTFAQTGQLQVTADGAPLLLLNELEWVDGELLANVWHDERIARIDPATGRVRGWIDLGPIVRMTPINDGESVLNGIAWDRRTRRLYVTGKNWPTLYRIKWPAR